MRSAAAALLLGTALLAPAALAHAAGFPGTGDLAPFQLSGQAERYTADNLWERINGEAELYRRFGLREATVGRFEVPGESERSLEVSVFRVGTALEAFGLFASFRDPGKAEEPLGNGGQVGDALAYFWHGPTFVHVYASGPEATRGADLRGAAQVLARRLGAPPERPAELAAFEAVADPATVRYQPDHLLGREALPPGLEGTVPGGPRVAAGHGAAGVLSAYGATLGNLRRFADDAGLGVTAGTDPALGPVTLASAGTRIAAVLAPASAPGTGTLLKALLEPPPLTPPRPAPP